MPSQHGPSWSADHEVETSVLYTCSLSLLTKHQTLEKGFGSMNWFGFGISITEFMFKNAFSHS